MKTFIRLVLMILTGIALGLGGAEFAKSSERRDVDVPTQMLNGEIGYVTFEGVPSNIEIPACIESILGLECMILKDGVREKNLIIPTISIGET